MSSVTIRTKLILSLGVLLALVSGVGLFGLSQLRAVNAVAEEIRDDWLPGTEQLGGIKYAVTRYRLFGARQVQTTRPEQFDELAKSTAGLTAALEETRRIYRELPATPEERARYEEFGQLWDRYVAVHSTMLAQARAGDVAGAVTAFNTTTLSAFNAVIAKLDELIKLNQHGSRTAVEAAQATYDRAVWLIGGASLLGVLAAIAAAAWIIAGVSAPMLRMTVAMRELADGNLETRVPGIGRGDEIGRMAAAVEVFRRSAQQVRTMEAEQAEAAERAVAEKRAALTAMADRFEAEVTGVAQSVAAAAEQLQANACSMSDVAKGTNHQSTLVAAASRETSANVHTVAAAAEELSASVAEIGGQVTLAANAADQAAGEAQGAGSLVRELATSVDRIGQVVVLINQIAAQTNLLALNATIEAARAGEAGRGFAVVASEVKQLATQTSKATEEIAGQVGAVQQATEDVVRAIGAVANRIGEVNGISAAIAAAVQEQGAAVNEIARNVAQAAQGTEGVGRSIGDVRRAAAETGQVAGQMVEASTELARQSEVLTRQIDSFMRGVRSAA